MLKIKRIWFLLVLIAVAACQTANIPTAYNYKKKELQTNLFGSWMELTVRPTSRLHDNEPIAGELLHLSSDSVFLLINDGEVYSVKRYKIVTARLYTHKNQANTYLLTTGLLAVPSVIGAIANPDYAGEFMTLALPSLIIGISQTVIESSGKRNILRYPERNSLVDFSLFARFPGGMPENTNRKLLYLKKN